MFGNNLHPKYVVFLIVMKLSLWVNCVFKLLDLKIFSENVFNERLDKHLS